MSDKKTVEQIYNPHQQNPQELIDSFVVRRNKFRQIYKEISEAKMETPEQHLLIVGQRGMGKTTLLLRLSFEVERDKILSFWLIPLVFTEEQYAITALFGLWEQVAKYLEDKHLEFVGLFDQMDAQYTEDHDLYERTCFALLTGALHKNKKKVLLFIDNIGDILSKFKKEESQRLRERLITSSDIRIIGASAAMLESFFDYSQPFYEFFKLIRLEGLNKEATQTLLLKLGEHYEKTTIRDIIENDPGRIEALRRLSGGVIRTIVLLFEIFIDNHNGNAFQDLQKILDRVTPLYKHRMDDLPVQQQKIIDVIAHAWDAIATKEIASKTRLESKKISAQLKQLQQNGIIETIPTDTKNHLYQLKERFFNIWYLMRHGRRYDKQRVVWLTRFLEGWCDRNTLNDRIKQHIDSLRVGDYDPEAAYFLAEAMARANHGSTKIQHELLDATKEFLIKNESEWANHLSQSDVELMKDSLQCAKAGEFKEALKCLKKIVHCNGITFNMMGVCYMFIGDFPRAEEIYYNAIEAGENKAWLNLGIMYRDQLRDFTKAEEAYQNAIKAEETGAWLNLGNMYRAEFKDFPKAEEAYHNAIEAGETGAWLNLGIMYCDELRDFPKAEEAYHNAIEAGETGAWLNLGIMYRDQLRGFTKAEEAYQNAIKAGETGAWLNLGNMYRDQLRDFTKAEEAYQNAIEVDENKAWLNLGDMYCDHLKNFTKAEEAYQNAITTGNHYGLVSLAQIVLERDHDFKKAEKFYTEADQKGVKWAINQMAYDFYRHKWDKQKTLEYAKKAHEKLNHHFTSATLAKALLWNNLFDESFNIAQQFLFVEDLLEEKYEDYIDYLLLLLAKEQYALLLEYFDGENGNNIHAKDRLKPVWYALMYYLQAEHPVEYLRMGSELKETVEEIIEKVEQMRIDYN